jgi:hypothetical protein
MRALARPGAGFLLAAVVCALAAATAQEAPRTSPTLARAAAEQNAKTPAGKRYEGVLVSRAEEWLRPALERCVKDAPAEERISFDAFVRVGVGGKAEEVVFAPQTAVARCVAPEFGSAKYPSPPQPSWWVKIEVRLK